MQHTSWYEYVAVFAGIASVWYSRAENILVYPVGLINTIIYIYISFEGHLLGRSHCKFILYHHEYFGLVYVDQERSTKRNCTAHYLLQ